MGRATVKDTRHTHKKNLNRPQVYPRNPVPATSWKGKIDRLSWGGQGLAHAEDGRIILLSSPVALFPGEVVEASLLWKARHGEGHVVNWISKDKRRTTAHCPAAGVCGGCDLMEAGDAAGDLKRLMVEDLFGRQLGREMEWQWLEAPAEALRHRIQLHWSGKELGFHGRKSHRVIAVDACPAAARPISDAIPRFREALLARMLPTRAQRWELATGTPAGEIVAIAEDGRTWFLEPDGWKAREGSLLHDHGAFRLRHAPGGFYQVSPAWAAEAFGRVLGAWGLEGDTLFDLYGGVGFFSALLGPRFQKRILVEFEGPAVVWAERNLEALGLDSECIAADAAEWVPEGLGSSSDLILLDPPRAGLAPELCERLQTARAGRLVLVGCDGAAFCRDIKRLSPAWRLVQLAALDLFPQTHHVECLGLLEPSGC